MGFFGSGKTDTLGVDIGTSSIKAVHLGFSGGKPVFKNFAIARLKKGSIQTSDQIIAGKQISKILNFALEKSKIKCKNASFSVPNFSSFVSFVNIPKVSDDELPKKLEEEAKKFIPVPLSEVTLGWEVIKDRGVMKSMEMKGGQQMKILLMAIGNETIKKYETISSDSNLSLGTIEPENFSLIRCMAPKGDSSTTAILDVGSRICNILIVAGGQLKGTKNVDAGGGDITNAIARGLGIDLIRSEAMKKEGGLNDTRISELIIPVVGRIVQEAKRMIGSYNEKNPGNTVQRVLAVGGTTKLKGFKEYMSRELGVGVSEGDPWSQVSHNEKQATIVKNFKFELAVAIGVAMS